MSAKILVGSEGLGIPDPALVEKRAWEVAAIEAHETPTSADWAEARRELHGRSTDLPGDSLGVGDADAIPDAGGAGGGGGGGWAGDFAPEEGGILRGVRHLDRLARREGDQSLGEELYREGMEEAEHERMLLARRALGEGVEEGVE